MPPSLSSNASRLRWNGRGRQSRATQYAAAQSSALPVSACNVICSAQATPVQVPSAASDASVFIANADVDDRLSPGASETAVVFTPDAVRLHDHPAFAAAAAGGHQFIVPVLVAHQGAYDSHGGHCAWHAAASDLRCSLRKKGSDLVVIDGNGFNVSDEASEAAVIRAVLDLCRMLRAGVVYTHACRPQRKSLLQALCEADGLHCVAHWNGTLLRPGQLPFEICDMPEDCDTFFAATELVGVDVPLAPLRSLPSLPPDAAPLAVELPTCPIADARSVMASPQAASVFPRSETDALRMVNEFFTPAFGIASTGHFGRTRDEKAASRPCGCVRETSSVRCIDSILGRLRKSLRAGTLSARGMHRIMSVCELSESSPRRYCAKLELLEHDFAVFCALKHDCGDTAVRDTLPRTLSTLSQQS